MELDLESQGETLQSMIQYCLLEINRLKLKLTELQIQQYNENSDERIKELENLIVEKEEELSIVKYRAEEEINVLNKKVQDQESIMHTQENRIYELDYITNSLEEIKEYFAEQLNNYKKNELAELNDRLNQAYISMADKDAQINTLNKAVDNYKVEVVKLEKEAQDKEEILYLKQQLHQKSKELILKDNELSTFKQSTISRDDYLLLQQELSRKEDKIKRLEEINEFFTDLQQDAQSVNTHEKIPPFRLDKK